MNCADKIRWRIDCHGNNFNRAYNVGDIESHLNGVIFNAGKYSVSVTCETCCTFMVEIKSHNDDGILLNTYNRGARVDTIVETIIKLMDRDQQQKD